MGWRRKWKENPLPDPLPEYSEREEVMEQQPQKQSLPVLNTSSKVEQLRKEPAAPRPVEQNIVSRFVDPNKNEKQRAVEERVIEVIRGIYDPEIPVNIYDLGLIYGIDVHPETGAVKIRMTLTAPACPVAGALVAEVENKVENLDEVPSATVELV